MKKLTILVLAIVALLGAHGPSAAAQEDYRVIVNRDNPADSITKDQLSDYLLKKDSRWDHGEPADPVDLDSGSDVRQVFSKEVHGRSVSSIKNYWQRQIFSGRGVPPPEVTSDQAVIDFVRSRPGAIGYVSSRAQVNGVKTLTVADG